MDARAGVARFGVTDHESCVRSAPIIRAWDDWGHVCNAAARRDAGRALIPRPVEANVARLLKVERD